MREARVVAVVLPPGDGPFESYIEDALHAARYGAVVVPIPADADARSPRAPSRTPSPGSGPPRPTPRRRPSGSAYAPGRPRRGRALLAVVVPVFLAAFVATGILAFWAAAPAALLRLAKRFDAPPVVNVAHLRAPEVALTGMRSNQGWSLMLHLRDPAKRIEYRLDSMSEFASTGQDDALRDHDTLEPMAKTWFDVGQLSRPITLAVRFTDKDGAAHGPFKLRFDPLAEEIRTTRASLVERGAHWVDVLDVGGKPSAYFSLLLCHRPAFRAIHYGFDTKRPETNLFFVPTEDGKSAQHDQNRVVVPTGARFISIDIEFKDGTHLKRQFPVDKADRG